MYRFHCESVPISLLRRVLAGHGETSRFSRSTSNRCDSEPGPPRRVLRKLPRVTGEREPHLSQPCLMVILERQPCREWRGTKCPSCCALSAASPRIAGTDSGPRPSRPDRPHAQVEAGCATGSRRRSLQVAFRSRPAQRKAPRAGWWRTCNAGKSVTKDHRLLPLAGILCSCLPARLPPPREQRNTGPTAYMPGD